MQRELAEGRAWEREEISADEARATVRGRGRAVQGRARRHRRGRDLALHAGRLHRSLSRPASADLGADQGLQAHLARRRLLARRREERPADAHLRDGVLQPEGSRRPPRAARAGDARETTGGSGAQLDLFHFDEHSPGSPFWHPKGMAIFNELEDLRRRENARRGYSEVKTPLIYDKALWVTSGHWEKFRENMFLIPIDDEHTYAVKPMNCPGHMLLFGSQLRSYRDLPMRYAEAAPLHRNELAGALHGLTRVRYVTQDDAHIFCTQEQIDAELDGCARVPALPVRALRDRAPGRALDPARQQARQRRGVGLHRGQAASRPSTGTASRTSSARARARSTARRSTFTSPTCSTARGSSARSSSMRRCRPASGSPTWAPTTTSTRCSSIHRALLRLVRALHRDPHRALRRRVPALARTRAGAGARRSASNTARLLARSPARLRAAGYRVDVDERDETLGKRIRDSELEKVPVRRRLGRARVGGRARRAHPRRGPVDAVARRAAGGARARRRDAGAGGRGSTPLMRRFASPHSSAAALLRFAPAK